MPPDLEVGRLALERGLLTPEQLNEAMRERVRLDALLSAAQLESLREEVRRRGTTETLRLEVAPAQSFGKFVLDRQVGTGGFGAVYKAWQTDLGRHVALKFLHSQQKEHVQRFTREAQTAAKLSHPHIVPIYEVGECDGKPYLAMKFIDGRPLNELRLDPRKAAQILRKAAEAVHFAHERGIIHRDLKPANMMLDEEGHVWVMDFGLARPIQAGATLTVSGLVVGTPAYMAPEQASGSRCDERSDVYSLGATLYELLTGHPPFEGAGPLEVMVRLQEEEPLPPRRRNPKVHAELDTIVLKALEKNSGHRYASAQALAEDLGRHLEGRPIEAKPAGAWTHGIKWVRRHRLASALTATLLLGASLIAGFLAIQSSRFHGRIRDLLARAEAAERDGRFGEARDRYGEVRTLTPGHPIAEKKFHEMEGAAASAAKRQAAEGFLRDARAVSEEFLRTERELAHLRAQEKGLLESIEPYAPADAKRPLWDLQRKRESLEEQSREFQAKRISAYTSALGVDPENREGRAALAETYFRRYERAEWEDHQPDVKLYRELVRLFDDGVFESRLTEAGTFTLDSRPSGAEVRLFRSEEVSDRRLSLQPYDLSGVCPIPRTRLPNGSYLLVLRKAGFREVRYPLLIRHGIVHEDTVNLYEEKEIDADFVYVPGGRFILGGDPLAYHAKSWNPEASLEDFFIAKFETTVTEYEAFLNDRGFHELDAAMARVPRHSPQSREHGRPEGDRIVLVEFRRDDPVVEVSWHDAVEFARWKTEKAKKEGRRVTYRLPTTEEWEKAARGADGRFFPWGRHFDWTFAKGGSSRAERPALEPVGTFPTDESPYGIRDLAGGVREWCDGWFGPKGRFRNLRGGGWNQIDPIVFRAATGDGADPNMVFVAAGFRLVAVLERR